MKILHRNANGTVAKVEETILGTTYTFIRDQSGYVYRLTEAGRAQVFWADQALDCGTKGLDETVARYKRATERLWNDVYAVV